MTQDTSRDALGVEVGALDLLGVRLDASDLLGVRTGIEKEIVKP